jgi:hypothetical protein
MNNNSFSADQKKRWNSKLLVAIFLGVFLALQILIVSAMAQSDNPPLYGKMENLICKNEIGIEEIDDKCLLFFEAKDGSPKYGIIFDAESFYFKKSEIEEKFGYIDRNYFELLKSGKLLYQLQELDDSYFYVFAKDNGYNSIVLIDSIFLE